jgi:LemA protein
MKNKKANAVLITFGFIFLAGLLIVGAVVGIYNSLVNTDLNSENSWSKVLTAYQRRADLIPNLVNTVKGSTKFEQDTQTQIAALRSGIQNAKTPTDLNKVGNEMNGLISGLIVNVEAYPDLKSNANFLALQDELAGTESRIKWERDNYNDAVKSYKARIRTFPSNIFASMFGFSLDKWNMFEATEGSENAPTVTF